MTAQARLGPMVELDKTEKPTMALALDPLEVNVQRTAETMTRTHETGHLQYQRDSQEAQAASGVLGFQDHDKMVMSTGAVVSLI